MKVSQAVSYTHLDVYKRQGFTLVGLFMTLLAFLGFVDRRTRRN